jgi:glutathione S-transferase
VDRALRLISHNLCPYVQRTVIVASEKGIPFERVDIDLAAKPAWFLAISPTGKTPLLEVTGTGGEGRVIFESAVIAEFLDELAGEPLLPRDIFERARHRSWVEFASATLNTIGQLYLARDSDSFEAARAQLADRLLQVEREIEGPWFAGPRFGLVDAAFGPAFRYLDVFRANARLESFDGVPAVAAWAWRLAERPTVRSAVAPSYPRDLVEFVRRKGSWLGHLLQEPSLAA